VKGKNGRTLAMADGIDNDSLNFRDAGEWDNPGQGIQPHD
jgi:hypothetical protein